MTFRWERANQTFSEPSQDGEAGSELRIQIQADSLGSYCSHYRLRLSYLFLKATMSAMSTILLDSQTLAPSKLRVRDNIIIIKNLQKLSLFRYFVEERGQRAGADVDHRGGDCGGCVVAALDPPHLLLFLPEVPQRLVGRESGHTIFLTVSLCHFETNGSEAGGVGVRQIFRLDAPGLSPLEILHSDYV